MSFFAELKRRNVFRVGIAYTLMGWVLLQGADFALDLVGAPNWVIQSISVVVVIGLPIALFFAWAFEVTPEGVKRESEIDRSQSITSHTGKKLNGTILVLLVVSLAYFVWESRFSNQQTRSEAESVVSNAGPSTAEDVPIPAAISRQSIAVLPFDNRSRLQEDEFFVEGIHDDLLTKLARIGSLKVISRTSVSLYKDSEMPIPEIARELGVATIMEGAVQRAGDTVRINVQLIDAETDEHLWAQIYDRKLTAENLFSIQTEISQEIANALQATLTTAEQERISEFPTQSMHAYNAYLRGRQLIAKRNSVDLERALQEFEQAVEIDPDFALAWVGIAETNILLPEYGTADWEQAVQRIEMAANRALEINPNLGEAYASLAQVASLNNQPDEAEQAYRKSIELNPGYATAYHWYSNFVRSLGPQRYREGLELLEKGLDLDPHSAVIKQNIGVFHRLSGDYELAEQTYRNAVALNPEFAGIMMSFGRLYSLELGKLDEGFSWYRKGSDIDPGNISNLADVFFVLLGLRSDQLADKVLERMVALDANHPLVSFSRAYTLLLDGRPEAVSEQVRHLEDQENMHTFLWPLFAETKEWDKARKYMVKVEPGLLDRQQWPVQLARLGTSACQAAKILIETGDTELGQDLIAFSLDYATNVLPRYIKHADRYPYAECHLLQGNVDAAIAAYQKAIDQGHEIDSWWAISTFPSTELLRRDPSYPALAEQVEEILAPQRVNVERMFEEWENDSL